MTADRPYRKGRSEAHALAELETYAGRRFDPACVAAFKCPLEAGRRERAVTPEPRRAPAITPPAPVPERAHA